MKPPKVSDFPELRRVFAGYFHEDFLEAHGSPREALRAFQEDANDSERRRFQTEARRFLKVTASHDFGDVRELMARLGCRWTPRTRQDLVGLLAETSNPRSNS